MDLQHPAVVAAAAAQHVAAAESRNYVTVPQGVSQHRPHPPAVAAQPPPTASSSSSMSTPLRIDTREAVKVGRRTNSADFLKCSPPVFKVPAPFCFSLLLPLVQIQTLTQRRRTTWHSSILHWTAPLSVRLDCSFRRHISPSEEESVPTYLDRQQNFKSRNPDSSSSLIASLGSLPARRQMRRYGFPRPTYPQPRNSLPNQGLPNFLRVVKLFTRHSLPRGSPFSQFQPLNLGERKRLDTGQT